MTVDYLLRPPAADRNPRPHAAIGILVGYSVLLLLIATTYFRLFYIVATNPGYVLRGPQWQKEQNNRKGHTKKSNAGSDKIGSAAYDIEKRFDSVTQQDATGTRSDALQDRTYAERPSGSRPLAGGDPAPDLRDFYTRDVFACEGDGRPIWCSTCLNWKPDRAHHCREAGRCVKKMDHFCPW